jgi:hypothetical protein
MIQKHVKRIELIFKLFQYQKNLWNMEKYYKKIPPTAISNTFASILVSVNPSRLMKRTEDFFLRKTYVYLIFN